MTGFWQNLAFFPLCWHVKYIDWALLRNTRIAHFTITFMQPLFSCNHYYYMGSVFYSHLPWFHIDVFQNIFDLRHLRREPHIRCNPCSSSRTSRVSSCHRMHFVRWLLRLVHILLKSVPLHNIPVHLKVSKGIILLSKNIRCTHAVCKQTYSWGASALLP